MSVFRNIRVYPSHGTRSATITWEIQAGIDAGDVYVAFSETGTDGSWESLNAEAPVASEVGMYADAAFIVNKVTSDGFYRLLLTTDGNEDFYSEPIRIMGDLTAREYGIVRAIIHQEFTQMRVTNGFPVWHCIPKDTGEESNLTDPDTGVTQGLECTETDPAVDSYGLTFKGGFHPPVLTWMRVLAHNEGLQDDNENFSPIEIKQTSARLMAFPRPARGHMLIDPTTDERWLVSDEIKPFRLRGVTPIAYEATLEALNQRDERYKFQPPSVDTKAYRKIRYWTYLPGT